MKLVIMAGLAIVCILLAPASAVPAGGGYIQNSQCALPFWQSSVRNCACNYAIGGPFEFNREFKNGTTVVEISRSGRGFALSGSQFHVVNIVAKARRTIDAAKASKIRDLLRSNKGNKTSGELKNDVLAIIGEPVNSGSLRIGRNNYELVNMNVASAENSSAMEADLSLQAKGAGDIVGHIKLTTETYEDSRVSSGDLMLNGTDYKVLVNMMPSHRGGRQVRGYHWGIRGR